MVKWKTGMRVEGVKDIFKVFGLYCCCMKQKYCKRINLVIYVKVFLRYLSGEDNMLYEFGVGLDRRQKYVSYLGLGGY